MKRPSKGKRNLGTTTPALVAKLERNMFAQIRILRKAIKSKLRNRAYEITPLLLALTDTAVSIDILARCGGWNEMIMLSRAFIERTVNACYLLVCDEEEFENYFLHMHQKAYRLLSREISSSSHSISVKSEYQVKPDSLPDLEKAIKRFTSEKGREITHWTRTNLIDRINVICGRTKCSTLAFLGCTLLVYDPASEALHGTLYGCTFHLGIWSMPVRNMDDTTQFNLSNIGFLFHMFSEMINNLLKLLAAHGDVGELVEKSNVLLGTTRNAVKKAHAD